MTNKRSTIAWLNWIIATTYVLFQFILQSTVGLMAEPWKLDFHLNDADIGSLSAAFYLAYVALQIPVGFAYDYFGPRNILVSASVILSLGILGLGLSQTYWQAYFARLAIGCGSGFGFVGMLYVTASWFDEDKFTLLVGISETLAMLGVALTEIIMASSITHYGWRATMLGLGGFSCILSIAVFFVIKNRQNTSKTKESKIHYRELIPALMILLRNPVVWLAGLYGFVLVSIINVFASLWAVPFLKLRYAALSYVSISALISILFIGAALGGPACALLLRKGLKKPMAMILFAAFTLVIFAAYLYANIQSYWLLYLMGGALGFFSAAYILIFEVVKEAVPEKLRGTALSTANMILMSSTLVLQPLIGKILQTGYSYEIALSVITLALLIAIGLAYLLKNRLNRTSLPNN